MAPGSSSRSTRRARCTSASTASASCRSPSCCARWATRTRTRSPRCSTTRATSATRSRPTPRCTAPRRAPSSSSSRSSVRASRRQVDNARNLLNQLFFDPKRYDLTRVGRYKLNARLGLDVDLDTRTLTHDDIIALIKELVSLPKLLGIPEDPAEGEEIKDYAAEAVTYPREPIAEHIDEYEHFGNRRLRTVGELIQEAFRIGLYRMERVVRERLTTEDADTITPQTIINIRPVVAALKEFYGSSQLSQFMDQTNSLSGLTHRRRLSALGAGGLTRERAPIEVRDVHPTHYGRMCPIETPEGPNIGLIGSLSSYAQVSEHGFVTTPYRVVKDGKVTDEVVHLDATQEEQLKIAFAHTPMDENGTIIADEVVCRTLAGQYPIVPPTRST